MKDLWKNRDWAPMLLGEVEEPFNSNDYIYELKFDGIRAIIFANPKELKVISRNSHDITNLYPELQNIKKLVKKNTILDGEIVVMNNGVPSFSKLQERSHLKKAEKIKQQVESNPVIFVCFDLLYENKNLINLPLLERKKKLDKFIDSDYFIKTKYISTFGNKLFKYVEDIDLEGIIAKRKDSLYEINSRSDNWLKIKNFKSEEFFVGGYIEKESNHVISLLLGEFNYGKFYYIGKVTLGKKRALYTEIKKEKVIRKSPFQNNDIKEVNYITPKIKCMVKYIERTDNNSLRQPFIP